jgi:hypothetical protein
MTLRNMREHGVRAVGATCAQCHHEAVVNVDSLLDDGEVRGKTDTDELNRA